MQKKIQYNKKYDDPNVSLLEPDELEFKYNEHELANGIILQAVKDYRGALSAFKKFGDTCVEGKSAKIEINSIETFFRSQWFGILTSIDPEDLIKRIKEEYK